jgi:hypothetical protein
MTGVLSLLLLAFMVLPPSGPATADESKELRKQRHDAQQERQKQKNARAAEINEATRDFKEYARDLKTDYRAQLKDLDTGFELRRVELKADHKVRVAGAEAEYQKKLPGLFMDPGVEFTEQSVQQMQTEAKAFADALFELKKRSAEELHRELIANEEKKNALLSEADQMALDEASKLGLTAEYVPILATPIGDGLTSQEERWNDREEKEAVKLEERNRKTLSAFRNGDKLRQWEIGNLNEDFKLTWDEKAELHALDSQRVFYNTLFVQAAQGEQFDRQKYMAEIAELNEKTKLIRIEYRKIRDKNRITRREEKKAILAN